MKTTIEEKFQEKLNEILAEQKAKKRSGNFNRKNKKDLNYTRVKI